MAAEGKNSEQEKQTVDDACEAEGEEEVHEEKEEVMDSGTTENRKRKSKPKATTSKKERRRTQNINAAFGDLRNHIPNVPADTKLSKIKTLKLAMSYIRHLEKILNAEEGQVEPKSERRYSSSSETEPESEANNHSQQNGFGFEALVEESRYRRRSTRTGWPQHVWALELMNAKKPRTMVQQSV